MSVQSNLENAASGLLMMSESDFPFDYFSTNDTTVNETLILKFAGKPEGTLVEKTTIDRLFRNVANPESGSVSAQTAQQFQNLAETLKQQLQNPEVYRVGEVQVQVLIIGLTAEGTVAGMRTYLIET